MRLALGGFSHETHTFAPYATKLEDFGRWLVGEEVLRHFGGTNTEVGGMMEAAEEEGVELVPTFYASATPSGLVERGAYEAVREELLGRLKGLEVDGVLLSLHGAMVAEGEDDVEGAILEEVKGMLGVPVAATLDFHANISSRMASSADLLVGYDTYPHTDMKERGREALLRLVQVVRGEFLPASALRKPPVLPSVQRMVTSEPPMSELMEAAHRMESEDPSVLVTVSGGFPFSDVSFAGMGVVVYTDGDRTRAEEMAEEISRLAWERRREFVAHNVPVEEAVREAVGSGEWPVVLADVADNVGGGSPGDGTALLSELLRQGAEGAVVVIADPEAVELARRAGEGAEVEMEVGGKADGLHGGPVRARWEVLGLYDGRFQYKGSYMTGLWVDMGPTAVVRSGGVRVVLTTRKTMPFDLEQLRCVGIEPEECRIIVVKSAIAWRAAYGPIAKKVIYVDTPGLCRANLRTFQYRRVRRPIFPLDDM